jgi:hypothetical protein
VFRSEKLPMNQMLNREKRRLRVIEEEDHGAGDSRRWRATAVTGDWVVISRTYPASCSRRSGLAELHALCHP